VHPLLIPDAKRRILAAVRILVYHVPHRRKTLDIRFSTPLDDHVVLQVRSLNDRTQTPPSALVERHAMTTVQQMTQRVLAEYLEMPGLRLRAEQVQRLCGIEPTMCHTVLDTLVDAKFLYMKADGQYARLTEGMFSRPQFAKAALRSDFHMTKAS
jgi:hypothetical protein